MVSLERLIYSLASREHSKTVCCGICILPVLNKPLLYGGPFEMIAGDATDRMSHIKGPSLLGLGRSRLVLSLRVGLVTCTSLAISGLLFKESGPTC